ncbi:P-loop containing nucleoside triphosphate hydrolase protein [Halteromyces radiatus]|uniref:P-loop containing nucleoside triphosphate hydrolase protein n=1 Tax=Halteromyces radiatus TaxID=101107 RepID=UPI0022200C2A|nr:P-loop containing nucleoside triphosphate hydrolase protein [Halteromyces radiatus]KAI8098828.1 P-loop containing nucleoside triphosphate hydrolase protein [Halteromyces radiatus]
MAALGLNHTVTKSKTTIITTSTKVKGLDSNLTTPSGTPTSSRAASPLSKIPASKRINVLEEYAKRSSDKPKMNLVVIGHVDAGKSTLMGHFLYDLGNVNERMMQKYERDSQKIGKGSFAYAWVLDETGEERDRGITMDIAMNHFETPHRQFTLLDAPGHRDFIPNMISGTAQADAAILVVDAATGGFESGFDANGQTKEHALLARSLGVQQLVVAVNKLDVMGWDQARFDEITAKLGTFLLQAGYRKNNLTYVPVSGLTGDNLVKRSQSEQLSSWYDGPCLLEVIDMIEPPVRLLDKPFRMGVTDFFKGGIGSSGGVSVAGSIDSGSLQVGEQVMVVPGNEIGIVKNLQVNDETTNWGAAGDSILMTLSGLDILNLSTGCVLCTPLQPVPITTTFTAQIVVFDIKIPITSGFPVILHHQSSNEPASITKLLCSLDKSTGEVVKRNPRHLSKGATAKVKIQLSHRAIPLETFKDNKQLGRIMLRKGGETVAAGVVDEVSERYLYIKNLIRNKIFIFISLCFRFLPLDRDMTIINHI